MTDRQDDVSNLIYLADTDTYELLYLNQSARTHFGVGADLAGRRCYDVLQQRDDPCPFCTNHLLKQDQNYVWEHTNPVTGHHYLLNDQLVEWEGRLVRMEVAFDVTDSKEESVRFRNLYRTEQAVLNCAQKLYRETDLDEATNTMLELLGEQLSADRTYIFILHGTMFRNTHEWCAPGISSEIDELQEVGMEPFRRWIGLFDRDECVVIENLALLEGSIPAEEFEMLAAQNITSLVAAPLERDGKLVGVLGIDNPPAELIRDIASPLRTLCYFYLTTMQRIEDEERLRVLSFHDGLTGLFNRNRYIDDIEALKRGASQLGVVFLDINGMKEINDCGGHAMGDRILQECADTLRAVLGERAQLYRIGGDEFVALAPSIEEDAFDALVDALQQAFARNPLCKMAIGAQWLEHPEDVSGMLFEADEAMYRDKRQFYRQRVYGSKIATPGPLSEASATLDDAEGEVAKACGTFMDALQVGIAKHVLDDRLSVTWANVRYYELARSIERADDAPLRPGSAGHARLLSLVREAFAHGDAEFSHLIETRQEDGTPQWIRLIGTFSDEMEDSFPVMHTLYVDITRMQVPPADQA